MKTTYYLTLALFLVGPPTSFAQKTSPFHFGLTMGLTANQVRTPSLNTTTPLAWGYKLGIALEQRLSSNFALNYQLQYAQLRDQVSIVSTSGDATSSFRYDYLNLPVLLRYQPRPDQFFLEAGGQVGYFLSGRSNALLSPPQALAASHITLWDAGLSGGVGYGLAKHLLLELRYYYGLKPIYTNFTDIDPLTGIRTGYNATPQYHRNWSLQLSYYF